MLLSIHCHLGVEVDVIVVQEGLLDQSKSRVLDRVGSRRAEHVDIYSANALPIYQP
jgi:hypothetical protein